MTFPTGRRRLEPTLVEEPIPSEGEASPTPRLRFRAATSASGGGSLWSAAQNARLRRRLRACGYR